MRYLTLQCCIVAVLCAVLTGCGANTPQVQKVQSSFAQGYMEFSLPDGAKARLGKGEISGNIAYSPDGARLAVAGTIGIWLYDTTTHQEVALLSGHTDSVRSVVFSHDALALASGSSDHTIRL